MNKIWDIIIIGAGPAGTQAAHELSSLGHSVLIIEKNKRDREKICGGGIFVQEIIKFGELPKTVIDREIRELVVHSKKNSKKYELPQEMPSTYIVKRSIYDKYLQDIAIESGTTIIDQENVININFSNNLVTTNKQQYSAKLIIDASGYDSVIAKQTDLIKARTNDQHIASYKVWLSFDDNTIEQHFSKQVDFFFNKKIIPDGYIWIFPKKNVLDIGIGTIVSNTKNKKVNLKKNLLEFIKTHPLLSKGKISYSKGGMIPCKIYEHLTHKNTIMIGDAAGISSPIHGGGIYYARLSGQIAAKHCSQYLKNMNKDHLINYEKEIRETLYQKEFKWDYKLRPFLGKNKLLSLLLKSEKANNFFIELFTGTNNHENIFKNIISTTSEIVASNFNPLINKNHTIFIPDNFNQSKLNKKTLVIISYCLKSPKCPVKKYSNKCVRCGKCSVGDIVSLCKKKKLESYIVTSRDDYISYMDKNHNKFKYLIAISCNYIIERIAYLTHLLYGLKGICIPLTSNTCKKDIEFQHGEKNNKKKQTSVNLKTVKKIIKNIQIL